MTSSRSRQAQLVIDGRGALKLEKETVRRLDLKVGQEVFPSFLKYIKEEDIYSLAQREALRLLTRKLRSTQELIKKLRHLFPQKIVERLRAELTKEGLLNDSTLASSLLWWRIGQGRHSLKEIKAELKKRGFERPLVRELLGGVAPEKEEPIALKLAYRKAQRTSERDWLKLRDKIGTYLRNKGFSYPIIARVLKVENFSKYLSSDNPN